MLTLVLGLAVDPRDGLRTHTELAELMENETQTQDIQRFSSVHPLLYISGL